MRVCAVINPSKKEDKCIRTMYALPDPPHHTQQIDQYF